MNTVIGIYSFGQFFRDIVKQSEIFVRILGVRRLCVKFHCDRSTNNQDTGGGGGGGRDVIQTYRCKRLSPVRVKEFVRLSSYSLYSPTHSTHCTHSIHSTHTTHPTHSTHPTHLTYPTHSTYPTHRAHPIHLIKLTLISLLIITSGPKLRSFQRSATFVIFPLARGLGRVQISNLYLQTCNLGI